MSMLRPDWREGGGAATVGLEVALSIVIGFAAGRWLDAKLDSAPWLALAGTAFGLAAASRFLWRATRRMRRAMEQDGFKPSSVGRPARYALDEREKKRGGEDPHG
jgi:F0F1-type ATP synthase assembly protein I